MSDYLDPNNEELLKDFFLEAQMQVDTLEQNILVLENEPENREAVDEIFRAAHTLKGGAATVQMMELSEFTHLVEDVLDDIRSDQVNIDGDVIDTLLNAIDIIKSMLQARTQGEQYDDDISPTEGALKGLLSQEKKAVHEKPQEAAGSAQPADETAFSGGGAAAAEPELQAGGIEAEGGKGADAVPEAGEGAAPGGLSEYELLEMKEAAGADETVYAVSVDFNEDNPMNTVGGIQVFAALKECGQVLKTVPDFELLYEDNFYPTVVYYLASEEKPAVIKSNVNIPDVITGVSVNDVETGETAGEGAPGEAASVQAAQAGEGDGLAAAGEEASSEEPVAEEEEAETAGKAPEKTEDAGKPEGEQKKEEQKKPEPKKVQDLPKTKVTSSVLRVDSSRIDSLLNLISEAVINKATFNQIGSQFLEALADFQAAETLFKDKQKELFDALPDYLEMIQDGTPINTVKKEILEKYGDIFSLFDVFENKIKTTINDFRGTAQVLGRNTSELHEKVLQIRMVPISQIFSRFPRLVRDLSKSLNKKINLIIEGEDTELDKSVIEDLLDPLIHIVRNSVDHGIEPVKERKKAGKPEEGRLLLKASNEGNMILIEISDDGKGIDVESVREKAIERGVIHPNKNLSDVEAFNLIFEPGFSTAKEITNVSGRGVGLDVVKKQIEKLNGSVRVTSTKGAGTKIMIKLPLTLAIIQGLLVRVGKEIYAIPITSVLDSHRIKPSEIKMIDNYEVFNVREDVISLIRLNRLFGIQSDEQRDYHFVVIVGSAEKKMGLMVDSLIGEEDVVIKPLKDRYTNSPGIAGATILGDGTVSLIIDVSQLLDLGLRREIEHRKLREAGIGS